MNSDILILEQSCPIKMECRRLLHIQYKMHIFFVGGGGNVSWCSHYGKQYGGSSRKLKIELPYDPAIPLLSIYPEKTIIQKDTCGASLVVQWLRIRLPMQGTLV